MYLYTYVKVCVPVELSGGSTPALAVRQSKRETLKANTLSANVARFLFGFYAVLPTGTRTTARTTASGSRRVESSTQYPEQKLHTQTLMWVWCVCVYVCVAVS